MRYGLKRFAALLALICILTSSLGAIAEQIPWNLTLVNSTHAVPEDWVVPEFTELRNGQRVDSRIYPELQAMFDAARAAGRTPLVISSYRTYDDQKNMLVKKYRSFKEKGYSHEDAQTEALKWAAYPGYSEHQLGLAVDIVDANMQDLTDEQENTETQKWLMANSWRYGFIHRYPNDKTDITGIIYEPWHYRYVGKAAAQDIFNRDITLEEYVGKTNQS